MKTLGYVVIMLIILAFPARAAQVYSGCAIPSATSRHVWYVDPVHGKTPAAGGRRFPGQSMEQPFQRAQGSWGANVTVPGYCREWISCRKRA
jgi:hypothetical protein